MSEEADGLPIDPEDELDAEEESGFQGGIPAPGSIDHLTGTEDDVDESLDLNEEEEDLDIEVDEEEEEEEDPLDEEDYDNFLEELEDLDDA